MKISIIHVRFTSSPRERGVGGGHFEHFVNPVPLTDVSPTVRWIHILSTGEGCGDRMSPLGSSHVSPRPRSHEPRADIRRQQRPHMDQRTHGKQRELFHSRGIDDLRRPPPNEHSPNEHPPNLGAQPLYDRYEHHRRGHPGPAIRAGCPRVGLCVVSCGTGRSH